ncbi:MAG: pilus assembly protein [Pseudomonadales bacterium]
MMIQRQSGVALFMSLVMLLILTLLGLSSVQTTTLQERMSRNARDTNLAFQAAEAAVKEAEVVLEGTTSLIPYEDNNNEGRYYSVPPPDGNGKVDLLPCSINATPCFDWENDGWSEGPRGFKVVDNSIDGVSEQPRYMIEFVKTVVSEEDRLNIENIGGGTGSGRTQMFRATALGYGGTETAQVLIQITYGKRF